MKPCSCHIRNSIHYLFDLHWLPVRFTIQYKILHLSYCAMHNLAQPYMTELFFFFCQTRSGSKHLLAEPNSSRPWGDSSFSATAPPPPPMEKASWTCSFRFDFADFQIKTKESFNECCFFSGLNYRFICICTLLFFVPFFRTLIRH